MNEIIISSKGDINESTKFICSIINKTLATLSLIEDGFLDSAYMPCRTVIEMYVKFLLLRTDPKLFEIANKFAYYDLDMTNCSKKYNEDFNKHFDNRKDQRCKNKIEFLHYGFVDEVSDYHNIVKQKPYSINGIINYLKKTSDDKNIDTLKGLEYFYKSCNGYVHGNVVMSKFPLLHYFELSIILGLIVPNIYEIICDDTNIDKQIMGIGLLDQFNKDFDLLVKQYQKRTTELLKLEKGKYTYHIV